MSLSEKRVKDRRVQKTQELLRNALTILIREKAYDDISVKEILDRANIGRSTFYMHFNDKDELLVSCIQDILLPIQSARLSTSAKRYEQIIKFSLPMFEHIYQHRRMSDNKMGIKGRSILHEHLQRMLAGLLGEDVKKHLQGQQRFSSNLSPDLLAQHVAATFVLVLNWWVESNSPLSAKEVNDLFRSLILPTLISIWE